MIYFDNAATTMHKPETVIHAVAQALNSLGNAGRGAHEASLDASRNIYGVRHLQPSRSQWYRSLPDCPARH